jgi:hypothetical protein
MSAEYLLLNCSTDGVLDLDLDSKLSRLAANDAGALVLLFGVFSCERKVHILFK